MVTGQYWQTISMVIPMKRELADRITTKLNQLGINAETMKHRGNNAVYVYDNPERVEQVLLTYFGEDYNNIQHDYKMSGNFWY